MVHKLLKISLMTLALVVSVTSVKADIFYHTKVTGKITHVSLISDTEKIATFNVDISFSSAKCRATVENEEIPCTISHLPSHEKDGLNLYSYFKVILNLHKIVEESCRSDSRCEKLLNLTRYCSPNFYEVSYRRIHIPHLNDRSAENILQIDTPSKEEAFHVISKIRWPEEK